MKQIAPRSWSHPTSETASRTQANDTSGLIVYVFEDVRNGGGDAVLALTDAGYEVHQMQACRNLVKYILAETRCRLVLFDLVQPSGPCFRLCGRLRALWRGPILIILREAARTDVMRTFEAGADMYLVAPFDPTELLGRVTALLRRVVTA